METAIDFVREFNPVFVQAIITMLRCYIPFYFITRLNGRYDHWNIFTRIGSTLNAIRCVYMVIAVIKSSDQDKYYNLSTVGDDYVITTLYLFSAYLFVDGVFHIPSLIRNPSYSSILSILHHFVGGLGIYLIAARNLGLGLGIYFAWTEVSTPLLNMSWVLYNYKIKNLFTYLIFGMFYIIFVIARICTIPILISYIIYNHDIIHKLGWIEFIMVYYGSGILASLNITWWIMLTRKLYEMIKPNVICSIKRRKV